ncbi:Structural maintenance of chromosomes family protein [Prunus dulcis]|uniref:Structural maintenance of chromosomes family protein n=1 Tax=Prunus dulcis TaxID=3755 RepID=A0A4Y1RN68_PRUDU|nr:Structural maintenance of chromosomes family protein [Prunus dulcis]
MNAKNHWFEEGRVILGWKTHHEKSLAEVLQYIISQLVLLASRIMEGEKQLSILCQKQGRAIQFSSKAARDKCLQKEIDDLERVLSSSLAQILICTDLINILFSWVRVFHFELTIISQNVFRNKTDLGPPDVPGAKKLQDELKQLNAELSERDAYIDSRGREIAIIELNLSSLSQMQCSIIIAAVEKAEKCLDHATAGVSESIDGQSKQLRIIKDENTKLK